MLLTKKIIKSLFLIATAESHAISIKSLHSLSCFFYPLNRTFQLTVLKIRYMLKYFVKSSNLDKKPPQSPSSFTRTNKQMTSHYAATAICSGVHDPHFCESGSDLSVC